MKVTIGEAGLENSWQDPFDKSVDCVHCQGKAEIAFVNYEGRHIEDPPFICQAKETTGKKGGLWLHDCCAVAVYFCRDCLQPTAHYNQG